MCKAAMAKWIRTKFSTTTPWTDLVIYLKLYPDRLRGLEGLACEIWPLPLTFASKFKLF